MSPADPECASVLAAMSAGSANETLMAVRIAVAWGCLVAQDGKEAVALLDRMLAILWRMTRG